MNNTNSKQPNQFKLIPVWFVQYNQAPAKAAEPTHPALPKQLIFVAHPGP